jgi:hypothetical protein
VRFSNPIRDGLMCASTIGPKHFGQGWGRIAIRLGSNKTANDGMKWSPATGGSTTLSVTGRCPVAAVMTQFSTRAPDMLVNTDHISEKVNEG